MIELIPLQPAYCEEVAEIAKSSLPEHWSLKGVQDVLRYDHNVYYVAYDREEGRVVGFAGIMLIAEESELLNIAVDLAFRGQGIGQMLLDKVLLEAANRGAVRMLLEVRRSNHSAIRLYTKNCFKEIGERKGYYQNPVEDALIMDRGL